MLINSSFVKRLYTVTAVCGLMAAVMMTGCENSGGDTSENIKPVETSKSAAKIKKKALQKIKESIEENAENILKDKAERIRDSVQELNKNEDGKYYYGYTSDGLKVSIETDGFDDGNHGKYQLLETYQEDDGLFIAMLHRTEDEKIYGEVYKYMG